MEEKCTDCTRFSKEYRGSKIYIAVGKDRVDALMENRDQFYTLAGLQLIDDLINRLLSKGDDICVIASICKRANIRPGDICERYFEGICHELEREERPEQVREQEDDSCRD